MNKFKYNLSQVCRLSVPLIVNRGDLLLAERITSHINYLRNIRRGSRISRVFRHLFELKSIKSALATPIAAMVLASTFVPASGAADMLEFEHAESQILSQQIVQIKTERAIQKPTAELKITQGYSWYHRGLDIDGVTGDPIKPIMPGIVGTVEYSRFGYGNSVIIKHGDGLSSLYAHMSKIYVEPNQRVTLDTVLGEMGSTGRSTGDHLHLEVRSGESTISPYTILD